MTDKDFARIKARFPALRWKRWERAPSIAGVYALHGHFQAQMWAADDGWRWRLTRIGATASADQIVATHTKPLRSAAQCLSRLECAILREARTLAGMVGMGVAL